jgi:AAA+ ATPase superfamily predicted ATPase
MPEAQKITGRKEELAILKSALTSAQSELIAVYGRRRVGKTFLIRNAYHKQMVFEFSGTLNTSMAQQLGNFHIAMTGKNKKTGERPANWFEAFEQLKSLLLSKKKKEKKVVFFDELPWLDTMHSGFLQALDYFWNTWASRQGNIIVVVCGSAAAWMINKIIFNKGGLHNRVTQQIRLLPFNLYETEQYLLSKKIKLNHYQLTQVYMCFGGVPHYLNEMKPGLSAAQNIENCCFKPGGLLYSEFDKLYVSLFDHSSVHKKIIQTLASRYSGFNRNEIIRKTGLKSGGYITEVLEELIQSGFVDYIVPPQKAVKDTVYRLSDEYSLFYLKFIKNNKLPSKSTWTHLTSSHAYKVWSGFAFETICLKHIRQIKAALGISDVSTSQSQWSFKSTLKGAQIDLFIDRADQSVNVCELKFWNDEFEITKSYATTLETKMLAFAKETKTRKALFLTFISTYGVKSNTHAINLGVKNIVLDDLFKF